MKQKLGQAALGLTGGAVAGVLVSATVAQGYPAGPNVSLGANPIVSVGGTLATVDSASLMTAPSHQAIVITDLALTGHDGRQGCLGPIRVALKLGSGPTLGVFSATPGTDDYAGVTGGSPVIMSMQSGLLVPAGDTLEIETSSDYVVLHSSSYLCSSQVTLDYMIAGHYAAP